MYKIYALRSKPFDPIVDPKTKEVLDDGVPKQIKIGEWEDKATAKNFATNVQASMDAIKKKMWKIWIE